MNHRKISLVVEQDGQKVVRVVYADNVKVKVSVWIDGKEIITADVPKEEK